MGGSRDGSLTSPHPVSSPRTGGPPASYAQDPTTLNHLKIRTEGKSNLVGMGIDVAISGGAKTRIQHQTPWGP